MLKPRIIAFIGTVGAGKTTHMKLLAEHLRSNRLKVKITWLKVGHLWAYPFYMLASMGWPIFKNKWIFKMWVVLDMLAISLKFLISIWIPLKVGRIVLVEEYLPAIVADYLHIARINGYLPRDIWGLPFIYRLAMLAPFTSVFLDADDNVLRERWRLRGTPNEKPGYIFMQRKLLLPLTKLLSRSFIYIDTSDSTVKEINYALKEHLVRLSP